MKFEGLNLTPEEEQFVLDTLAVGAPRPLRTETVSAQEDRQAEQAEIIKAIQKMGLLELPKKRLPAQRSSEALKGIDLTSLAGSLRMPK